MKILSSFFGVFFLIGGILGLSKLVCCSSMLLFFFGVSIDPPSEPKSFSNIITLLNIVLAMGFP